MADEQNSTYTMGVHHVGLSVDNLTATTDFFVNALNYRVVGERPAYPAVMVSDGVTLITLWQIEDATCGAPFDRRKNVGLHHFAVLVKDSDMLDKVHARVIEGGATIEFAPEARADGKARHMMCSIPGGPRMEFIALTPDAG